ncbi:unnamed protein product [Pseudo-nitzschia multistriata]|uniref:EF-hand domain-containing protein n=1 Tax=Pseudo-nitzschia multistriata TaxID=183589 RepID=A0A448ZKB7_9STRA|nr:unnamed protein product [Pseudo-nitzschia multistriata]
MGNTGSSASPLSAGTSVSIMVDQRESESKMMAVASKISLRKARILALRTAMLHFSDDSGMIHRDGFDKALVYANLSQVNVLDLLFTMWDTARDEKVSVKDFCIGISPLACPQDDLSSTIDFALRMSCENGVQYINRQGLRGILTGKSSQFQSG